MISILQMNIPSLVITPYNSNIKYKYSLKRLFFSKKLQNSLRFPYIDAIFRKTLFKKVILKNIILYKENILPNIYINCNIIGGLKYVDENGNFHTKIISIPNIPEFVHITDITKVSRFTLEEIKLFHLQHHSFEKNKIKCLNFIDKTEALDIYNESCLVYEINKSTIEENTSESIIDNSINRLFKKLSIPQLKSNKSIQFEN